MVYLFTILTKDVFKIFRLILNYHKVYIATIFTFTAHFYCSSVGTMTYKLIIASIPFILFKIILHDNILWNLLFGKNEFKSYLLLQKCYK